MALQQLCWNGSIRVYGSQLLLQGPHQATTAAVLVGATLTHTHPLPIHTHHTHPYIPTTTNVPPIYRIIPHSNPPRLLTNLYFQGSEQTWTQKLSNEETTQVIEKSCNDISVFLSACLILSDRVGHNVSLLCLQSLVGIWNKPQKVTVIWCSLQNNKAQRDLAKASQHTS